MPARPQPPDPDFERHVRGSFDRQGLMSTYRTVLDRVEPGLVEIGVPFAPGPTQQDGFFHAGVVIAAVDSACGYAARDPHATGYASPLTVELKVNLLAPAAGSHLTAGGEVLRPGRTLTVCRGDAYVVSNGSPKHVATFLTTMASVSDTP